MGAHHFGLTWEWLGGGGSMERRIRIVGLCLVVGFALSAVIAAGAQASTEIVSSPVCVKASKGHLGYKGHYLDKHCTVKASEEEINLGGELNKYELDPGPGWVAKGKAVKGKAVKILLAQGEIVCSKSGGSGMVLGPTRVQATLTFAKCESKKLFVPCTTRGLPSGDIETKTLLGVIGEGAGKEVLVSFTGKEAGGTEPAPGEQFAEFDCGELITFDLHGTLSGKWTEAANEMTKKGGIDFAVGTGEQGLIAQFVAGAEEPEEEAVTLEATQSFNFGKSEYEMKQE
jgi:hypothetical protein